MAMDLDRTVLFAAGATMLVVAVVILVLRPGRGVNRALAALVGARGAALLLPQVSTDPAWAWAALNVQPYIALAVAPLALYALHVLRRPSEATTTSSRAGWIAAASIAVLDLAYLADHDLFQSLAQGTTDVGALRAAPGIVFTGFGPLAAIASCTAGILAYAGLALAVDYRQRATTPEAPLLLFVSSGLLLGALFDGASRLAALTALLDHPGAYPWAPWGWAIAILPTLAILPGLLGATVLSSRPAWRALPLRRVERTVVVLAALACFSGFLRLVAPPDSDVGGSGFVPILLGAWRLVMPLFIGYAFLRYPIRQPGSEARPSTQGEAQALPPDGPFLSTKSHTNRPNAATLDAREPTILLR